MPVFSEVFTMQKTNEFLFSQFGSIYFHPIASERYDLSCEQIKTNNHKTNILYSFPCEVYIEPTYGIGSILIGKEPNNLSKFPIHHCLKIQPNTYFYVVSRVDIFSFSLLTPENITPKIIKLSESYTPDVISMPFHISQVFDCSYLTQETPCTFYKTPHNYHELIYVCEGYIRISEHNETNYNLNPHDLILLSPNENTSRHFSLNTSCSYLTIILDIELKSNEQILNEVFSCPVEIQSVLWQIVQESTSDFYYTQTLMLCHLHEMLSDILRLDYEKNQHHLQSDNNFQNNQLKKILSYMDARVTEPLTIEDICHEFFMSRSSLQTLFKINLGCSPKNYLINIKLQKSKELIRKNEHTISEIAYLLGFSSIHYFSRLFKKYFQISPSDYARGIEPASHKNHLDDGADDY